MLRGVDKLNLNNRPAVLKATEKLDTYFSMVPMRHVNKDWVMRVNRITNGAH